MPKCLPWAIPATSVQTLLVVSICYSGEEYCDHNVFNRVFKSTNKKRMYYEPYSILYYSHQYILTHPLLSFINRVGSLVFEWEKKEGGIAYCSIFGRWLLWPSSSFWIRQKPPSASPLLSKSYTDAEHQKIRLCYFFQWNWTAWPQLYMAIILHRLQIARP